MDEDYQGLAFELGKIQGYSSFPYLSKKTQEKIYETAQRIFEEECIKKCQ